jgi:hypothetical protein
MGAQEDQALTRLVIQILLSKETAPIVTIHQVMPTKQTEHPHLPMDQPMGVLQTMEPPRETIVVKIQDRIQQVEIQQTVALEVIRLQIILLEGLEVQIN